MIPSFDALRHEYYHNKYFPIFRYILITVDNNIYYKKCYACRYYNVLYNAMYHEEILFLKLIPNLTPTHTHSLT